MAILLHMAILLFLVILLHIHMAILILWIIHGGSVVTTTYQSDHSVGQQLAAGRKEVGDILTTKLKYHSGQFSHDFIQGPYMEDIFTEPSKMKSHTHAGIWKQTLLHYFDFAKKKWHIDGGYKVPIICYVEQLVPEGVTTLASAEEIAKQVIDIVNTFRQQHHFTIFGVKPPGQSPKPTLPGAAPAPHVPVGRLVDI